MDRPSADAPRCNLIGVKVPVGEPCTVCGLLWEEVIVFWDFTVLGCAWWGHCTKTLHRGSAIEHTTGRIRFDRSLIKSGIQVLDFCKECKSWSDCDTFVDPAIPHYTWWGHCSNVLIRDTLANVAVRRRPGAPLPSVAVVTPEEVELETPLNTTRVGEGRTRKPWCGACGHMRSSIWGQLAENLVELVLAKLPSKKIVQLRVMSKGWNEKRLPSSTFSHACAEVATSKKFAVISKAGMLNRITFFDMETKTSTTSSLTCFSNEILLRPMFWRPYAAAGGLLCLLAEDPRKEIHTLSVVIGNPLASVWRRLPRVSGILGLPQMARMVADKNTGSYRVILVGPAWSSETKDFMLTMEVYSSMTNAWTADDMTCVEDLIHGDTEIFGTGYRRSNELASGVVSYNPTTRRLEGLTLLTDSAEHDSTVHGGSIFVLDPGVAQPLQPSRVWKFTSSGSQWLREDCGYRVPPSPSRFRTSLLAGDGMHLVVAEKKYPRQGDQPSPFDHRVVTLYSASDTVGRVLPQVAIGEPFTRLLLCELRWDVTP